MRSALSDKGITLSRDELLTRPEARTAVAEFMVKTGLLGQFQTVDPTALGEEGDDKGAETMTLRQCDGRRRMAPIRSAVPGPLYSLDPSERASGSRQDWTVGEKRAWEWCVLKWGPGPTLDQG